MRNTPSLLWIPAEAKRLADAGADRGKSWSLAQICEHLALVMEATVNAPADLSPPAWWKALGRFERCKRRLIRRVLLAIGRFPQGVPAPRFVAPSGTLGIAETLERLEAAARAFDRKLADKDTTWIYHPLLGKMGGKTWRRFHAVHAAHHFRLLRSAGGGSCDEPIA